MQEFSDANFKKMNNIISRLLHFEPIQYIFGHTLWYGLDLYLTPNTLIPRPETAELIDLISAHPFDFPHSPVKVLDIGTGSGCIALALKQQNPNWHIAGIDISHEAIKVAQQNALRNKLDVDFFQLDILAKIPDFIGHFDIIVSNPPYIRECEKKDMRPNVLNYEPASALFVPDSDPLLFYRRIASLHRATFLFFEINEAFASEMETLLIQHNYTDIHIHQDIYGKARIIEGRMA